MNTEQFLTRLEELYAQSLLTARNKNKDYSGDSDPFKNFKLCEQLGITSVEQGILVRISDKISRISNLLDKKEMVSDEKITDTLMDLSVYSNILIIWLEQKKFSTPLE